MAANERFDAIILGAGVVGVATAYWAARAGLSVCVIDRQPAAALETSFANGGQISVSHAEPWATPTAPLKVLKWLADKQAPLLFRPRLDPRQWRWIAGFLRNCTPARARANTIEILRLASYSRDKLQEIRATERFPYAEQTRGILHIFRHRHELIAARPMTSLLRDMGCERRELSPEEALAIEPALAHIIEKIVGATYTEADESGDARVFTQSLAARAAELGVVFRTNAELTNLMLQDGRVQGVEVILAGQPTRLAAPRVVVALGSWSAPFLRRFGIDLVIYPAKGYSASIPLGHANQAPLTSITDEENKLVYSHLGTHLRVAGTAELSGYSRHLNEQRVQALLRHAQASFPGAGDFSRATFWTGLRPTTPSNVPYIGATRIPGLLLNTGHGTLGWTMAAGSGRIVADLLADRTPDIPPPTNARAQR